MPSDTSASNLDTVPSLDGWLIPDMPSTLEGFVAGEPLRGDAGTVVVWCPWCETVHRHGAPKGGEGHASAHCRRDAASPLVATGYDLRVATWAEDEAVAVPDAIATGRDPQRLRATVHRSQHLLRAAALSILLNVPLDRARQAVIIREFGRKGTVTAYADGWKIARPRRPLLKGEGLVSLGAALFGVPAGVVAVRLLEAVNNWRFDARTALAIQAAIDEWHGRGEPERDDQ